MTVQLAVMALVVNVLPLSAPPQVPPTDEAAYPALGLRANTVVAVPLTETAVAGLMVPPVPETLGVTVYVP
jgi:hypothetical protein